MLIIKICYSARLRLYVNLFQSAHRHPLRLQRYNFFLTLAKKVIKKLAQPHFFYYLCSRNSADSHDTYTIHIR